MCVLKKHQIVNMQYHYITHKRSGAMEADQVCEISSSISMPIC